MLQNTSTFADRAKGSSKSNLKRPTCLNFRTKANLKRHEDIELLKEINFESQRLVGVAEMRSRSIGIDITYILIYINLQNLNIYT